MKLSFGLIAGVVVMLAMLVTSCAPPAPTPTAAPAKPAAPTAAPAQAPAPQSTVAPAAQPTTASAAGQATKPSDFPTKPITIIVPYGPGGGGDLYTRLLVPYLEKELGVKVVVENKDGAGAITGTTAAFNAPADGYTLLMWSSPGGELNPLVQSTAYKVKSFVGLGAASPAPTYLLVVPPNSPWTSAKEFASGLKANPGKHTIGTVGTYSAGAAIFLDIVKGLGTDARFVPYPGTNEMRTAVMGGHVDAVILGDDGSSRERHQQKQFRVIANLDDKPIGPMKDDVPIMKEVAGISLSYQSVRGHVIRAETPKDRLTFLQSAYERVIKNPEVEKLIGEKLKLYGFYSAQQYTDLLYGTEKQFTDRSAALKALANR